MCQPQSQKGLARPAPSLLTFPGVPSTMHLPSQLQAGSRPAWLIRGVWLTRAAIVFSSFWLGHPAKLGPVLLSPLLIQVKVIKALSFWLSPWTVLRRQLHVNTGCGVMINLLASLCGHTCLQPLVRTQKANGKPRRESSGDRLWCWVLVPQSEVI